MIGCNLVRAAVLATALRFALCTSQLSVTGAMQAVKEFAASLRFGTSKRDAQRDNLLRSISELATGDRPGRQEERKLTRS